MRSRAVRSCQFLEYGRVSSRLLVLARGPPRCQTPCRDLGLHRQQAIALQSLARDLAGAANGFCLCPDLPLRGFLIMAAESHLAENAFALHLLFQHPQRLVDIVVTDENLHECSSSMQTDGLGGERVIGGGLLLGPLFFFSGFPTVVPFFPDDWHDP